MKPLHTAGSTEHIPHDLPPTPHSTVSYTVCIVHRNETSAPSRSPIREPILMIPTYPVPRCVDRGAGCMC